MALVDWFTGISDALQVAFVSFVFTIASSLTTIWLTNRHTLNLERQRWENDRKRDEEVHARSQRDRELADQRRLVESLASDCSSVITKLAWLSAHSAAVYIPLVRGKGLRREDMESVLMPMEKITAHMGLCLDEPMRNLVGSFAEKCQLVFAEINGEDRSQEKENLLKEVSVANGMVQRRARETLNESAANL